MIAIMALVLMAAAGAIAGWVANDRYNERLEAQVSINLNATQETFAEIRGEGPTTSRAGVPIPATGKRPVRDNPQA